MRKFLACLVFLLLSSCASAPDTKIHAVIKNGTDRDLILRAGNGIFSAQVRLKPGESWSGFLDRRQIFSSAFIAIEKAD
jgi:hypothetical protein